MTSWLVTGGAGFIGTNFVRNAARATRARLVVLDMLSYAGNLGNISDLIASGRVDFIRGDVADARLVAWLFEAHRFERVVHLAAETHVDRSIFAPQRFIETNVNGTYVLLEAARKAWSDAGRGRLFIHVSTDEVFGELAPGAPPVTEESAYRPSSPYAASKAASDHLVRAWHRTYGLPTVVTAATNNYGPWQLPEKLIPLLIVNAFENRPLPIYGDGSQVRDWLHVEDHCEALIAIAARGRAGATYAISGADERTNLEIAHLVCQAVDGLAGRPPGTSARLIRHVADRPGHDRRYALDAGRLARELGWRPRHALDRALPDVARWYLDHRGWAEEARSGERAAFYERQYAHRLSDRLGAAPAL